MRAELVATAVAGLLALSAACGSGPEAAPEITVLDAFTIPGEQSLAVYLTLANDGGSDRIVGAELAGGDTGRAQRITLHETVERQGLSVMQPVDHISIPAGTRTALEPGGGHLMLEGLVGAVALGDTLTLTIRFDRSEPLTATVRVITVDAALDRLHDAEVTR